MHSYIATFHTHLSAMRSARSLESSGEAERVAMSPVPRKLSSSCGTCVKYAAEQPLIELMDGDMERVYQHLGEDDYKLLHCAEDE